MAASGVSVAARRLAPLVLAALLLAPSSSVALPRANRTAAAAAAGGSGMRACTYTLKVKTSCASPRRTADAVSVAFGDAYRNEVHAPRLPSGGEVLGRCATDTFRVRGACGYGVCYLYLRRAGRDGWAPEWVQVLQPGPGAAAATFYFGDPLPGGVWYGHNRCPKAAAEATTNNSSAPTRG